MRAEDWPWRLLATQHTKRNDACEPQKAAHGRAEDSNASGNCRLGRRTAGPRRAVPQDGRHQVPIFRRHLNVQVDIVDPKPLYPAASRDVASEIHQSRKAHYKLDSAAC